MSADFSKPTTGDNHATVYTPTIKDNLVALAYDLDPARVTPSNLPTYARSWSSANKRWESWNGSSWINAEPAGGYAINISGNAATANSATVAATATTAAACSGNAATATTAGACSGNAATATSATTLAEGTASTGIATTAFVARLRDVISVWKTGSYTLALSDRGKSVDTSAGVTVPGSADVAFPVGATVTITNFSASPITITQGAGVTLILAGSTNTGNRQLANYGVATLRMYSPDLWIISGAGLT